MIYVSIIVPVYNTKEEYLRECIESLLHQTLDNYEIILVNDASTDKSLEILNEYAGKYSHMVRVIESQENKKQGGARNLGIKAARGQYIAFMDSDDIAVPEMYEKLYMEAKRAEADVVLCNWERINDAGEKYVASSIPAVWKHNGMLQDYSDLFLNPSSVCCKLYSRSLLIDNNIFFPEHMFYEDNAWCPLCMLYVNKVSYVDERLYLYRLNNQSTTEGGSVNKYLDRCRAAEWLDKELKKRGKYGHIKEAADFWFFHCYYSSCVRMFINGFSRLYYKELCYIRNTMKHAGFKYWENQYYIENIRGYETEDKIYMRLVMISPLLGVVAVKAVEAIRKVKHFGKRRYGT